MFGTEKSSQWLLILVNGAFVGFIKIKELNVVPVETE
jgi:hypothetical protein